MISTSAVIDLADAIVAAAIGSLADLGGPDVEQAFAYDLAHAASAVATARSLLDYGAKGDSEARIACVFTADVLHDLAGKILGREPLWGVAPGALDGASEFIAEYRDPEVIALLAESSGPLHLTDDMDMVRDTFRAFAQDVIDDYNATPHSGLPRYRDPVTLRKRYMTPTEAWEAWEADGGTVIQIDPEDAADLFRPYE
ncbi:MAG: hypothetical protein CL410_05085, partial [Acidimicrobiaceae bacterium]|nr:hypothetical protein [Acidimicrobiaceae bacterium]